MSKIVYTRWGFTCERCKATCAVKVTPVQIALAEEGLHVRVLQTLLRIDQKAVLDFWNTHASHGPVPTILGELPQ